MVKYILHFLTFFLIGQCFVYAQVIPPTNIGTLGNSQAPTGWTKIATPELSSTLDNYYTAGDGWLNAPLPNSPSNGFAVFPVSREGSPLEGCWTTITGLVAGLSYNISYEYMWPKGVGPYAPRFDIGFANQGYIKIDGVKTYVTMHAGSGGVIDTWYCDIVSFTAGGPTATLELGIDISGTINNSAIAWAIGTGVCGVLPVEMLSFEASAIDNRWVNLEWQTVSEINNDYFIVEKSINGIEFKSIASIKGAGNSSTQLNYNFRDDDINNEVLYYRIKQIDFDGSSAVSGIRSVNFRNKNTLVSTIYPNPGNGIFEINLNKEATIQVYDVRGKLILNKEKNNNLFQTIDISTRDGGIYMVVIYDGNTLETKKLVKQ